MPNMSLVLQDGVCIEKVRQTFHADVEVWKYRNRRYVVKKIGPRYANLTKEDFFLLAGKINRYYDRLERIGIRVPREFAADVTSIDNKELVVNISSYCGSPVREQLAKSKLDTWKRVVRAMLENINAVFHAPENSVIQSNSLWLKLSLEPSLDNFVGSSAENLTYIDFTPPLLKETLHSINPLRLIPITQLNERRAWKNFRYFDKRGVILTFFSKTWAIRPEFSKELKNEVFTFLKEVGEEGVLDYLVNSPAATIRSRLESAKVAQRQEDSRSAAYHKDQAITLIKSLGPRNRDLLRLISLETVPPSVSDLPDYLETNWGIRFPNPISNDKDIFREIIYIAYKSPEFHHEFQRFLCGVVEYLLSRKLT